MLNIKLKLTELICTNIPILEMYIGYIPILFDLFSI